MLQACKHADADTTLQMQTWQERTEHSIVTKSIKVTALHPGWH